MKIGFDNNKYLTLQAQHIRARREQFGDKLYIEFGGKLFDDYHASRVLPGFQPDSKIRMLASIRDDVEIVVVICAGLLAVTVLYNLTNINITERVREIATIKVLGFHSGETGAYVFRENIILSMMGIVVGLPLGVLLHTFVLMQIRVDMVSFKAVIAPVSFLLTVVMVVLFTVITDLVMRKKIAKIDMAESLKSIE